MKKSIHQLLATASPNDAIGNEALVIQKTLAKMGYNSNIYAENIHPDLKGKVSNYRDYKRKNDNNDIFIYHHSIGSGLSDFISSISSKIIMIYHNITPPKFFESYNAELAKLLELGLDQLKQFKNKIAFAVGDSEYNRLELEKLGYKKTGVMPILLDMSKYKQSPVQNIVSKFHDSINIIYVGRIAPNKRVEELIKAFHYFNSNINSDSNLFLIGGFNGLSDNYFMSLEKMISNANIRHVHFITDANDKELVSYFSISDIFITKSSHEGFCVPLIESMIFKTPIIAYNSSAIPYTLQDSGILVKDETFEEIGELIDIIVNDSDLRTSIIEKQTLRLSSIYNKDNSNFINDLLNQL